MGDLAENGEFGEVACVHIVAKRRNINANCILVRVMNVLCLIVVWVTFSDCNLYFGFL